MKNSVKIAFVAAFAVVGIAACTPAENAAPPASTESSAPGTPTAAPSGTVVTETVTSTITPPAQPKAVVHTDDRPGYGALKLGMTFAEAKATGMIGNLTELGNHPEACVANGAVAISKKYGVERITLPRDAKTSGGIGVGANYAAVKKAYPAAVDYRNGYYVNLSNFQIAFEGKVVVERAYNETDTVEKIKLRSLEINCPGAAG